MAAAHLFVCLFVWCVCVYSTGKHGCPDHHSPPYYLKTESLREYAAALAASKSRQSPEPVYPSTGVTGHMITPGFLHVCRNFELMFISVHRECSHLLSHLPSLWHTLELAVVIICLKYASD